MSGLEGGAPMPPLEPRRQAAIDALSEHFANDVISVEEFERRVDLAHQARNVEELRALFEDLRGAALPAVTTSANAPARSPGDSIAARVDQRERSLAVAILGGTRRGGQWRPARSNLAVAVMGGVELDFREALLGPGVTELRVFALWGGVEVIVPPGVNVVSRGLGILGGFDHADGGIDDPTAPTLNVTGVALMGGVDVTVRRPDESARDARRRRRQERRDRARAIREGAGKHRGRLKP